MKISLEWVSVYVDLPADVTPAELAHQLTLKTVEVEDVIDTGATLQDVVLERVGNLADRPANLPEDALVAVRDGAICSVADLGLQRLFSHGDPSAALVLDGADAVPGTPLAQALSFQDTVLEIDNKSLTNRPDLWGHYGIAREFATIYGLELRPLASGRRPSEADGLIGGVDPALCQRLSLVVFSILDGAGQAPLWLRSRLARIGESSVNLCVDLSNYVMFTVGQPTHVYDAERITLPLSVSTAGVATKLDLLAGETREVTPTTPVIRDVRGVVGVAGVMGASGSAVTPGSQQFVLEVATFRPQPIRRASQQLALRTEASARFEKGLDTPRVDAAVDLFLNLLTDTAPTASVTAMQTVEHEATMSAQVDVELDFLNTRIGDALTPAEITKTLASLGFDTELDGSHLRVVAPTWRSTGDISLPHDIVEEVARIHGYDSLPIAPLSVKLNPVRQLNRRPLDRAMREELAMRAGMQEVVTYPWVSDNLLAATGVDKANTVRFDGAPAPDRDSLRPSLVPGLLEAVAANLRYNPSFDLFEVGTVFPAQTLMATAVLAGVDSRTLFLRAKGVVEMLGRYCHLTDLQFGDVDWPMWTDGSVRIGVRSNDAAVGVIGLLAKRSLRIAGIEGVQVVCIDLEVSKLSAHRSRENRYEAISDLPESDFDLSVVVADSTPWSEIEPVVKAVDGLIWRVAFVDEFRGSWVPDGNRSLTLRITLRPMQTTLTAEAISAVRAEILDVLERKLGARLRD